VSDWRIFTILAKLIDKIAKKDLDPESINSDVLEAFLPKRNNVRKTQAFLWLMGFLKPHIH